MENIFDRLQFVKHEEVFATREDAVNYVLNLQTIDRPSLVAEPMIMLYESGSAIKGPNVILAIGSVGDGHTHSTANRTFFIDTQKTEEEIQELDEKLEDAIKSLTLAPIDSDTIKFSSEKTDDGTILSGDVKIADYRIVEGVIEENLIETEGSKGIYAFVDMDYDDENCVIKFRTNKVSKEFQLLKDQHLEKGWYDPTKEALFFKLADDTEIKVPVSKLIEEWTVLEDASATPITLYKDHYSAVTTDHEGIYNWQDVLHADVRIANHLSNNILEKDGTGRYLYVKGTADNIAYDGNMTVKEAIDSVTTDVSTSEGNMIYKRQDGIYAAAMLDYNQAENKLIFRYTDNASESMKQVEFKLNSAKILEDITYDPTHEMIVIRYIDSEGEYQRVEIPVADIIAEWDVNSEGHSVKLNKYRSEGSGKDILTADVKIHNVDNNILEDVNHELYVNGIASNIKYDVTGNTTVKGVVDGIINTVSDLDINLNQEIANREAADEVINAKIGTGFTTDSHETVTYKFNELDEKVDAEIERSTDKDTELNSKIEAEVTRSTLKDTEHDESIATIEGTIGTGFTTDTHETVTYKFNELNDKADEIDAKVDEEIERATAKDSDLESKIALEKTRAMEAEADITSTLTDAIDAEETRATAAEQAITANLNAEATRATGRENEIEAKFDDELGEGFDIRNTVRDEIDAINEEIASEAASRMEADADLNDAITQVNANLDETNANLEATNATVNAISGKLDTEIARATAKENELDSKIDANVAELDGKIEANAADIAELEDKVDNIDDDYLINFDGTASISIEKTKAAKGYIVTAESNIDDTEDNNITVTRAGLYSKVNLTYNSATNTLTFINTSGQKDIPLVSNSLIDRVYYDSSREAIVIEYTVNGQRQPDVVVPVRDLINEIDVQDTDTVNLTKTVNSGNGADIITADVVLNTFHNDNILVNDGGLYVSGAKIDQNEANISALTSSLQNEIQRATEAENAIDAKADANAEDIADEISRATAKEAELESNIEAVSGAADGSLKAIVNTDHSIDVDSTDAVRPVIKVNISSESEDGKDNIIKLNNDGLYVGVDLSYEETANKLIFKTTNGSKEIQLDSMSSIVDIEYNPSKEAIVIRYMTNGHEIKTVEIPVGDLIDEWRVDDGHDGAIILEKERVSGASQDVLKASVVISDVHDDNMLINDSGSLYVSKAPINALSADVESLREEFEESLIVDETDTLKLERDVNNHLKGDVKISENADNLIKIDHVLGGLIFDGDIDCGEY